MTIKIPGTHTPPALLLALPAAILLASCGQSQPVNGSAGGNAIAARCGGSAPVSTPTLISNIGRTVSPVGRMTLVGNLPTGGALSPDGRFYWAVDAGDGHDDVQIVDVSSGAVLQTLPMPGTYGQMAFSPDGSTAYVSGEPEGTAYPPAGPTVADAGGAIHVFSIDPVSGAATEQTPIYLSGGASDFPTGIGLSPDGKTALVALYHANQAAVLNLNQAVIGETEFKVGNYPFAARIDRSGTYGYVSNAQDGTISKIDLASSKVVDTISEIGRAHV